MIMVCCGVGSQAVVWVEADFVAEIVRNVWIGGRDSRWEIGEREGFVTDLKTADGVGRMFLWMGGRMVYVI